MTAHFRTARRIAIVLAALTIGAPAFAQQVDGDAAMLADLVVANRILADQGIVDGFGHVSARSSRNPKHFYMAWARAPGMVAAEDIVEFDEDANALNANGRKLYSERYIHGEIYRARPDVMSVVHSHSPAVIPFGVSTVPLKPVSHMAGFLIRDVPVFDIRSSAGDNNQMLVNTPKLGKDLATALGRSSVILIRGHGNVVTAQSVKHAVLHAVYTEMNARIQAEAMRLGPVTYMNEKEAANIAQVNDASIDRPWEIWKDKALKASQP